MRYSLSCLLVLSRFVFQVKGFADDYLFYDENLGDPAAFFPDSSSDVFTLTDLAGNLIRDDNYSFDTLVPPPEDDAGSFDTPAPLPEEQSLFDIAISPPEDEGSSNPFALPPEAEDAASDALALLPEGLEIEPDSVVADCNAPDGLGRRGDTMFCPTDNFKGPELPTLDGITDKFTPPNEQDNALKEISPFDYQAPPGDNNKCPPDRPFQLCCNCDGHFEFEFCNDCLQSKPSLHFFEQLCCGRSPIYEAGVEGVHPL